MATTDTATTSEMLAAARVDAGHDDAIESAEWMNQIIAQLWPFISAFIETTLKRDVEPLVNAQVPDWLGSIAFGTVSLGATPLRIEGLDVIATGPAGTRLEADVYYDGDAQVSIDVVTKFLGTLSLGVQSIKLDGSIQFVMNPLVPVLPLMAATQLAFINRPTIAMDLTGLADVDRAASIKAIISNTIVDVLSGLLVLPNRVAAKVDPAADYFATYVAPAGVLRGTIAAGRDFQPQAGMFTTDQPDVYIIATLGDGTVTTPTVNNNVAPVWGTPFTFLVHNVRQALSLAAWEDDTAGDDALGVGAVAVADLAATADAWVPIAPAPTAEAPSPRRGRRAADRRAGGPRLERTAGGDGGRVRTPHRSGSSSPCSTVPRGCRQARQRRRGCASAAARRSLTRPPRRGRSRPRRRWRRGTPPLSCSSGRRTSSRGWSPLTSSTAAQRAWGGVQVPLSSLTAAPSRTVQKDAWQLEGGSCSGSVRVKLFLYGFGA
eukprot:TRINITY_DN1958_c0_g1_i11.p1 TRINITY_DN1958_c0_g1~~TRINITY_DN1958_c0_g1_i11.p1  ORF type:complete len:536 (-),score=163.46 TRINITY_DN1958_c0_g1_i11:127-1596(-)